MLIVARLKVSILASLNKKYEKKIPVQLRRL